MSDTSAELERRRQEIQAELAQLEQAEHEQAEQRRRQEQAERDAQLDPARREMRAELERRADEELDKQYPQSWTPQKQGSDHPPKLVGLVTRIDPRVGPSATYGNYSAVIELRDLDEQAWTVWANTGSALYSQLLRLRIQPGEVVAIAYRGLKPSQRNPGQSYQDFKLVRVEDDDGEPAPVDYDALQRQEHPALPPPEQAPPDDDIPF
jgi:hypothetical protein